jgi:hypothetical protein
LGDGTIDALCLCIQVQKLPSSDDAWLCEKRGEKLVIIAVSVQMITLGLFFVGAAVVLLESMLKPQQVDPMGMFGLPSVCAIACEQVSVKSRAASPIAIGRGNENRKAA